MTRKEIEAKYRRAGLQTRHIKDGPNVVYEPHKHGEVYLYTLGGSVRLKFDGQQWQKITATQEVRIEDGQVHQAIVGPEGWEYVFAASAEEVKRQGL